MAKKSKYELTATAVCVGRTGVSVKGLHVCAAELKRRTGFLTNLCIEVTQALVTTHWNRESADAIATGTFMHLVKGEKKPKLKKLAARGYVAVRELGWAQNETEIFVPMESQKEVYLPDRAFRAAEEQAMRLLRNAVHRSTLVDAVIATWPQNAQKRTAEEWQALEDAVTANGLTWSKPEARNRTRAIETFVKTEKRLPKDIFELEEPPNVANEVILAAADKQLVELNRVGPDKAEIILKLPLVARPIKRKDWERVTIAFTIGAHVPLNAPLHTPTLRTVTNLSGKHLLHLDLPFTIITPYPLALTGKTHLGHVRAVGADWGVNSLLTAALGTIDDTRAQTPTVRTDGRSYEYGAQGMAVKLHRLRQESEQLSKRIAHAQTLLESPRVGWRTDDVERNLGRDRIELERVSAKRRNLGREVAWAGASWLVDLALAVGATVIYLEDLATMEGRGHGKKQNVRHSNQVRGLVLTALRHQAAKYGITVVTVPARGTSSMCPRCLSNHKHVPSPDRLTEKGHAWAYCEKCGHSANRDHSAAERIVARGLAGQHSAHLDSNKNWRITKKVDVPVRVTRSKQGSALNHNNPGARTYKTPTARITTKAKNGMSRAKTGSTPKQKISKGIKSQPKINTKTSNTGGSPVRRSVPTAKDMKVSVTQRRVGTSKRPLPLGNTVVKQASGGDTRKVTKEELAQTRNVSVNALKRTTKQGKRRRRAQGRGFHPLSHPTWVGPGVTPLHLTTLG